jgi:hypothetical protein
MNGMASRRKSSWAVVLVVGMTTTAAAAAPWPPFLPAADGLPPRIVQDVERIWHDPTLSRRVRGRRARVPFDVYTAFVDAPEVTAAAARRLKLADYDVKRLGDETYEADDHDGSAGRYRVLLRTPHRRVILSWGEHTGRFLGTVGGRALTVLDFAERDGAVDQRLTAYVLIDNVIAARLARVLVPVFGGLADRKLAEGFAVTARVAEWAIDRPSEFEAWAQATPLPRERRDAVLRALHDYGAMASPSLTPRRP